MHSQRQATVSLIKPTHNMFGDSVICDGYLFLLRVAPYCLALRLVNKLSSYLCYDLKCIKLFYNPIYFHSALSQILLPQLICVCVTV